MLPPVPRLDDSVLADLAAALHRAHYSPAALQALWGTDVDAAREANDPAPARRHCLRLLETGSSARDRNLAVVALLFLLDTAVSEDLAAEALGTDLVAALLAGGLLVDEPTTTVEAGASTQQQSTGPNGSSEAAAGTLPGSRMLRSVLAVTCHPLPVGVPRGQRSGDDTLLLVADHGTFTRPDALDGEYVLGHGGAGRTLLDITPRGNVELAADIGTGCGIQAVMLARHAHRVIATDLSPRALDIARLTVGLAGLTDRVEFRTGSLYDPLPEAVDLLVSNPPFVITPRGTDTVDTGTEGTDTDTVSGTDDRAEPDVSDVANGSEGGGHEEASAFRYRDGGLVGDAIMRSMVRGAPAHLRPGGLAVMLGNWERGGDRTPPTAWLDTDAEETEARGAAENPAVTTTTEATTASAMVIERQRMRPAAYARTWIRDGGVLRASARWHADVDRWLQDFEDRGVDEVGFGWILLRREEQTGPGEKMAPSAPLRDLATIESGPGSNPAGLATFLETRLGLLEWLAQASDAELAATAYQLAADVTEHRHLRPGADDPTMITIEQGGGLAQTFQADPALAGFLGVCDGTLTLAQISAALAHLLGVEEDALTRQLVDQVRTLVPAAIIVPAGD